MSINPDNFQFIKAIDAALFVVCLDDVTVGENVDKIMRTYLHGDGLNRYMYLLLALKVVPFPM